MLVFSVAMLFLWKPARLSRPRSPGSTCLGASGEQGAGVAKAAHLIASARAKVLMSSSQTTVTSLHVTSISSSWGASSYGDRNFPLIQALHTLPCNEMKGSGCLRVPFRCCRAPEPWLSWSDRCSSIGGHRRPQRAAWPAASKVSSRNIQL